MEDSNNKLEKISGYSNNYSESKFWSKIKSIPAKVGAKAVYYALVLFYTLESKNVSFKKKSLIYGALGYLILPIDLIPDMLIPVGYTDDIAVLIYAVSLVQSSITPEIENKAKQKLFEMGLSYEGEVIGTKAC